MFQTEIEKGFINSKSFDDILAAYKTNAENDLELLEKYMKKKKGRPGATSMNITKEDLEEIMKDTLFSLFLENDHEYKIK